MKKTSRNDLCPCGSHKKYKNCCLTSVNTAKINPLHESCSAYRKSIGWFEQHHAVAFCNALRVRALNVIDEEKLEKIIQDEDLIYLLNMNLKEWLLAEGSILIDDQAYRATDLLLARVHEIKLNALQKKCVEQWAIQPIELYEVLDSAPGQSLLLHDIVFPEREPFWVVDDLFSHEAPKYALYAMRVVQVDECRVLTGSWYYFPREDGFNLIAQIKQKLNGLTLNAAEAQAVYSDVLINHWMRYLANGFEGPDELEFWALEPLAIVTDYYRVINWDGLEFILSMCPQIKGNRSSGWYYGIQGNNIRSEAVMDIRVIKGSDRIKVTHQSKMHADAGRALFEGDVAKRFLKFIIRDTTPYPVDESIKQSQSVVSAPQKMVEYLEERVRANYDLWFNSPQAVLNNKSPEEALKTAEGLEQVKFLLHTYEYHANSKAVINNHVPVSYDYVWQKLGIKP